MVSITRIVPLCTVATLALTGTASADFKVMQAYDFTRGYTTGAVQTSLQYGADAAGQGGWRTSGGSNTYFNIAADPVAGGTRGNGMSIEGSSSGGGRTAWTTDVHDNWGNRDAGSNTIYATWDQDTTTYTSAAGTASQNRFGAVIQDSTGTKILAGLYVEANTGYLYGVAYSTSGGATNNFTYNIMSEGVQVSLNRNAWQSLAITFNKSTGEAGFYYQTTPSTWGSSTVTGAAIGVDPNEFDLYQLSNSSTTKGKAYYDNILVSSGSGSFVPAPGAAALLGVAGLIGARRRR